MGCDIHTMAEVLVPTDRGETDFEWLAMKVPVFPNPYYTPGLRVDGEKDQWGFNHPTTRAPYKGRNYNLFAVLADVRNYGDLEAIEDPRGVPDDASKAWRKYTEGDGDLHSHSWFTLAELRKAKAGQYFEQRIEVTGALTRPAYTRLVEQEVEPGQWSQPGDLDITPAQFMAMDAAHQEAFTGHIIMTWTTTIDLTHAYKIITDNLEMVAPRSSPRGELDAVLPERVRIVFAFDN